MANLEWASETALELIDEYGTDVEIVIYAPGVAENDFEEADPVEAKFPVLGLFTGFDQNLIDGTLTKAEDRQVLVAGEALGSQSFEERLRGTVTQLADGKTWQIIRITQVAPDENVILYKFHVRV